MNDLPVDFGLNAFARLCHDEAKARGWHVTDGPPSDPKRIATMLLLTISELCEAFEEVRSGENCEIVYERTTFLDDECRPDRKPEGFPVEIADAFIRLGDTAAALGLDLDGAVARKLAYNRTRPVRHGNKTC